MLHRRISPPFLYVNKYRRSFHFQDVALSSRIWFRMREDRVRRQRCSGAAEETERERERGKINGDRTALLLAREGRCISVRSNAYFHLVSLVVRRNRAANLSHSFSRVVAFPPSCLPPLPPPYPATTFSTWHAVGWISSSDAIFLTGAFRMPDARSHFRWIVFSLLPSQRDGSS